MAGVSMFNVASKLLPTIVIPAFEQACFIWYPKDELDKLKRSIRIIQVVLLDAENKQDSSAAVKDWIKRARNVLYEADDFIDEVATDDKLKEHILKEGNVILSKVRVSCSRLNPIVSGYSIAKKVKAIRKSLLEISADMAQFEFVGHRCAKRGRVLGYFVDPKDVLGREDDKKRILEFLLNESDSANSGVPFVVAIVGIGGIGKTTLAHMIYNDDEVKSKFEKKWFVCISNTSDEKEVLEKIFQSICNKNYSEFTSGQMQTEIRKEMKGIKNFLLVLDNVWDEDCVMWQDRMSLFSNGSEGSKIIVTTRSSAVARVVDASGTKTHNLHGLSDGESWDLFQRIAFKPKQERDSRWNDIGREIVKKCANVPLVIKSVGSLLYAKTTIQEWESFRDQDLAKLEEGSGDSIMNTLKLSYEHLPLNLKHCFSYCSLFPKDFEFDVKRLIYFWIAQGYIKPQHELQTIEQAGNSSFMNLFRRCFFQEAKYNERGEVESCKMHDLVHDLAKSVSGEEICTLSRQCNQFKNSARHAGIVCGMDQSWVDFARPHTIFRLRSVLIDINHSVLHFHEKQLTKFKFLHTLSLRAVRIENVSSSIGELKHLRYVDLSKNPIKSLPDSMSKLVNLLTLNLSGCKLRALPDKLSKLINLRFLDIKGCPQLKHMPPRVEELTSLQYLSNFEVRQTSGLDALVGLMQQLRGELCITFHMNTNNWSGDECWQLPVSPHTLRIMSYPGRRIPRWGNGRHIALNLASLTIDGCSKLKYLPPISLLPKLKTLYLYHLEELEYLEEENSSIEVASGPTPFFPCLKTFELVAMPKLKGWRREVAVHPHEFPSLSHLHIRSCPKLKPLLLCPLLQNLYLSKDVEIQQLMSAVKSNTSSLEVITIELCNDITSFTDEALASLGELTIRGCSSLMSLHLTSPRLRKISIRGCHGLMSIQAEALPSLFSLTIENCKTLKNLKISHLNALEYFDISGCRELELWEQDEEKRCCIDWDSLPNLCELTVDSLPPPEKLPESLRCRLALGELQLQT